MKPLVLAIALSLAAPLTALAHTDDAKAAVAASQTASPAWVTRSNELAQILIDAQTRDIVQNVYIRKVEKVGGQLYNVEFETIKDVKDPGKTK